MHESLMGKIFIFFIFNDVQFWFVREHLHDRQTYLMKIG